MYKLYMYIISVIAMTHLQPETYLANGWAYKIDFAFKKVRIVILSEVLSQNYAKKNSSILLKRVSRCIRNSNFANKIFIEYTSWFECES